MRTSDGKPPAYQKLTHRGGGGGGSDSTGMSQPATTTTMPKQATEVQLEHSHQVKIVYVLLALFLANMIFFGVMWGAAIVNTGQSINQTFSYMLARDQTTQITYAAWFVFYALINGFLVVLWSNQMLVHPNAFHPGEHLEKTKVVYEQPKAATELEEATPFRRIVPETSQHKDELGHLAVFVLIWLAVALKLAGLLLILVFPSKDDTIPYHNTWAITAFTAAMAQDFLLFVKRVRWPTSHPDDPPGANTALLVFNFLVLVAQWVMAILFVVANTSTGEGEGNSGVFEFTLSILILVADLFIVRDFSLAADNVILLVRHVEKRLHGLSHRRRIQEVRNKVIPMLKRHENSALSTTTATAARIHLAIHPLQETG